LKATRAGRRMAESRDQMIKVLSVLSFSSTQRLSLLQTAASLKSDVVAQVSNLLL
jgi:hypothetical protein